MSWMQYFDLSILSSAVQLATPIALAALGGLMCQRCGVFNIGLEGMMLLGAFGACAGLEWFGGSLIGGLLMAVAFGVCAALVYALAVIVLHADAIVSSIAINLFGVGLTSYFLQLLFHTTSTLKPKTVPKIDNIQVPIIKDIPILGTLFSGKDYMVYMCMILVAVTAVILYKTHFGLAVRTVGESMEAAGAAGIKVNKIKLMSIIWSGVFCGLAGAYLSIVSVSQFSQNMVSGRGFTAFTAVAFGGADPIATWLVSLLLGFADALGVRFELMTTGSGSIYLVKAFPYVLSVIALACSAGMKRTRMNGKKRVTKKLAIVK